VSAAADALLAAHNAHRATHHAPALRWDASLAAGAQAWADACSFAHSQPGGAYGENLYTSSPGGAPDGAQVGRAAVQSWYDEVAQYDFGAGGGFSSATGHFTQLVWVGSTALGCGVATRCAGAGQLPNLVVCRYAPAGNFAGRFAENVLRA
jgi:hypothetical protein